MYVLLYDAGVSFRRTCDGMPSSIFELAACTLVERTGPELTNRGIAFVPVVAYGIGAGYIMANHFRGNNDYMVCLD